jgi:cell division protein FtsB
MTIKPDTATLIHQQARTIARQQQRIAELEAENKILTTMIDLIIDPVVSDVPVITVREFVMEPDHATE